MLTIVCWAAVIIAALFLLSFYQKNTNAVCKSEKRLDGKTALVTGGTDGMGLQIAIEFAKRGARVIVACPFPEEGANARKIIFEKTGNEDVEFKYLDFASLASVRQFASEIVKNEPHLDILMNNAGTAARGDNITKDGMNYVMQVNYFGQFLLTILLVPILLKSGSQSEPSRIVNTGSLMHHIGHLEISRIKVATNVLRLAQVYSDSKIALLTFTFELARRMRNSNMVVNAVDPGLVGTNIFFGINSFAGVLIRFAFRNIFKTPWEGAQTALHATLDDKVAKMSGCCFANCQLSTPNSRTRNEENARLLWGESARLVHITEEEIDRCLKGVPL